ncbi:hypothetical protein [Nocardia concava]|uniref:hypothetical protein n=1 Tax=Nocardia concava TaxID=257281 RepID=UPI0005939796|nr:hypothetical protein [Nocardia concava]
MSVQMTTYVVTTGVRSVEFAPQSLDQGGVCPPQIRVRFAGYVAGLDLDIDDARELFYSLGVALVEHDVALKDSPFVMRVVA